MEDFQGVSEGASPSAEVTTPSASPAEPTHAVETPVSPSEPAGEGSIPPVEGAGTAPAPEGEASQEIDPTLFPEEKQREAFIQMRQARRDAEQFKQQAEPAYSWIEQRGGLNYVQSDVALVDGLFSDKLEDRIETFYKPFSENEAAYMRLLGDLSTVPEMQDRALAKLGVSQNEVEQVRKFIASGAWKNQPAAPPASLNAETLSLIADPALQEVYKQADPQARAIADLLDGDKLTSYLQDQHLKQETYKYQQEQRQAQEKQQAQAKADLIGKRTMDTYQNVRQIVQNKLKEILGTNEEGLNFVLGATEGALWSSSEGSTEWNEIVSHIENGDMRQVQTKLPGIVTRALAIATKQAKYLNEKEEKARGYDEIMRLSSVEEIAGFLKQRRGGGAQPQGGKQIPLGGGDVPVPAERGRYDSRNVLSYWPGQR